MIRTVRAAVGILIAGLAFSFAGTASAAPPQHEFIDLDCGAAGMFTVAVPPGQGDFTPGKIQGGGMIIPVAFVNLHGSFTDSGGNVFEESVPDNFKGNGNAAKNKNVVHCDFAVTFEEDGGSGFFSGTVIGFIVGR